MKEPIEWHILNQEINNEAENYNHLMHVATYKYGLKFIENKRVLDYGCGSGYGSYFLSEKAKSVIGVDINPDAVLMAQKNYVSENLSFSEIKSLNEKDFDVITSFQVVEHVPDAILYIKFLKSLLAPNGVLLITTPNCKNRIFKYIQSPWNEHHLKEYSRSSFEKLLQKGFNNYEILCIGSNNEFALEEIKRTKKQRLVSIFATFSIYPYFLRVFLLRLFTWFFELLRRFKKSSIKNTSQIENTIKYSIDDIIISKNVKYETDFLAICKL
jgi:2-polyprenyl-3-methyl-5-hydroxy-6-metoxy-1,4-benzoquinol methylase